MCQRRSISLDGQQSELDKRTNRTFLQSIDLQGSTYASQLALLLIPSHDMPTKQNKNTLIKVISWWNKILLKKYFINIKQLSAFQIASLDTSRSKNGRLKFFWPVLKINGSKIEFSKKVKHFKIIAWRMKQSLVQRCPKELLERVYIAFYRMIGRWKLVFFSTIDL